MSESISERIINGSRTVWDEFYTHPFVLGIGDGTHEIEKFKHFMVQDYLYLIEYAKVFAIGAAKADEPEIMKIFAGYISSILDGEMNIHRAYMERLGIEISEAEGAYMSADCASYTSYMIRVAYEHGPAEICAAILPCAVSYEAIAKRLVDTYPACTEHEFYGEWIRGYSCEEYHGENEALMALTESCARGYDERRIERLVEIGKRCSLYEKAFWDMSWEIRR